MLSNPKLIILPFAFATSGFDAQEQSCLIEARANKSCLKAMRWHETGEAFGVRRPGAAFPALESENESLGANRSFPKYKAEKAAPGRRTPKASPISCHLIYL